MLDAESSRLQVVSLILEVGYDSVVELSNAQMANEAPIIPENRNIFQQGRITTGGSVHFGSPPEPTSTTNNTFTT